MVEVRVVNGDSVVIQNAVFGFLQKTKYTRMGHYWWVFGNLSSRSDILNLGVFKDGALKGMLSFIPEGKEDLICVLVYLDGVSASEVREEVKKFLRKLGVRRVYTYVWGPYERGEAAARATGGRIVGTIMEVEV